MCAAVRQNWVTEGWRDRKRRNNKDWLALSVYMPLQPWPVSSPRYLLLLCAGGLMKTGQQTNAGREKMIERQSFLSNLTDVRFTTPSLLAPSLVSVIITFLPPIALLGLTSSSRLSPRLSAFYSLLPCGDRSCRLEWLRHPLRWRLFYWQTTTLCMRDGGFFFYILWFYTGAGGSTGTGHWESIWSHLCHVTINDYSHICCLWLLWSTGSFRRV